MQQTVENIVPEKNCVFAMAAMDDGAGPSEPTQQVATEQDQEQDQGVEEDVETQVDRTIHPSGIVPQLQNVVATVNLECALDLKHIALHARNAEYNPKRFAAVIMRIRDPKSTALIFASGKMVCTGAKSETEARMGARKYARILQKLGFAVTFKDFKVQNMVGSCDVRFPIRLEGLATAHSRFASYEPELFPGLIYRMQQPKVVLLIFVSGKVVITGAKTRDDIYNAFETMYHVLLDFKKGSGLRVAVPPMPTLPPPADNEPAAGNEEQDAKGTGEGQALGAPAAQIES